MTALQNYDALKTLWSTLNGVDIAANLTIINSTVTGTDQNDVAILWPQANGWQGPINQNDLVPAGILNAQQRITYELQQGWITQQQANNFLAQS